MLLTIVVYIYTVIAFNFFRKFYVQEEDENVDRKCHDMLTCFVFHIYKVTFIPSIHFPNIHILIDR